MAVSPCLIFVENHRTPCVNSSNISKRRAIVEFRWDPEKYTNVSFQGNRQRGEGLNIPILRTLTIDQ